MSSTLQIPVLKTEFLTTQTNQITNLQALLTSQQNQITELKNINITNKADITLLHTSLISIINSLNEKSFSDK